MAIDIGAPAIDRGSNATSGYTLLSVDNPANDSGSLDTIKVWTYSNVGGLIAGTFFLVSGTTYECRDSEAIGSVTAGSEQTFTGLDIDVETDDLLGGYWTSGAIERDTSGFGGFYWTSGEHIDPTDQATFSLDAGDAISLYGDGETAVTEKSSSDTGSGADAKASGNPVATLAKSETGSGSDVLSQAQAILEGAETGSGVDAVDSLETPEAKSSSDAGSGAEGTPVQNAILAGSESGSGIEALTSRLLAALDTGGGAEASSLEIEGLLKDLFASELGEGADQLVARIEMPTKGGGMKLWT